MQSKQIKRKQKHIVVSCTPLHFYRQGGLTVEQGFLLSNGNLSGQRTGSTLVLPMLLGHVPTPGTLLGNMSTGRQGCEERLSHTPAGLLT